MFTLLKEEYLKVSAFVTSNPGNGTLKQKQKDLERILKRLKSESNLQEDLQSSVFNDTLVDTQSSVVEAA